jgi:hypothetical protein
MCCFVTALLFFGPRLAFLIYWLIPVGQMRIYTAFDTWIIPLIGLIFLPWTVLAYVLLFPINGFEWAIMAFAFLADISAYSGGYRNRGRVRR